MSKLDRSEVLIILSTLGVRSVLVIVLAGILSFLVKLMVTELGGEDSDPAMTAMLGTLTGAAGSGFVLLTQSVTHDVLGHLKERLGTRDEAEDKKEA